MMNSIQIRLALYGRYILLNLIPHPFRGMKKKVLGLIFLGFILTSTVSLYVGSIVQMNADQAQVSQYIAKLQQPGQTYSFGNLTFSVELTLLAYHHLDLTPRQNLID